MRLLNTKFTNVTMVNYGTKGFLIYLIRRADYVSKIISFQVEL